MKKTICVTNLLLSLAMALLLSCRDDNNGVLSADQNTVSVSVAFHTIDYAQMVTRASDSFLKNVTVLQFIDGTLEKKIELENRFFDRAVDLDGLDPMPAASLDQNGDLIRDGHENMIVFLANFKACFQTGTPVATLPAIGASYASVMDYTFDLADAQALSDLEFMPMTGFYRGGIAEGATNQINVTLDRLLARINFTLNTDNFQYMDSRLSVIVNRIELRNVPKTITFFPQNRPALPANNRPGEWPVAQTPYPIAMVNTNTDQDGDGETDADFEMYDAANFITLGESHNKTSDAAGSTFVAFMPENARGSYPEIKSNNEKHPATIAAGNQQIGWTYIYVDLDFTTSDGAVMNATYKIYLGGDDKGDINLLAGTQYNVTTYLYGADEGDEDTRITVTTKFEAPQIAGYTILPLANCYMLNPEDTSLENLVIPLTQAVSGWNHIQNSINTAGDNPTSIEYVDQLENMIKSGNWEVVTLWKTWTDATAITTVKPATVESAGDENYYAQLMDLDKVPLGNNCLLVLKSKDEDSYGNPAGTVWWSWHIWLTDYNPDADDPEEMNGQIHSYVGAAFSSGGLYEGKKMMDRHLGATITGIKNSDEPAQPATGVIALKYFGLMYQWGRKDPFTAPGNATSLYTIADAGVYDAAGNKMLGSGTTVDSDGFPKVTALNGGAVVNRLIDATRNPMNYYYNTTEPKMWSRSDVTLWTSTKTAFDPCPSGWHIPVCDRTTASRNPWSGFTEANFLTSGSNGTATAGRLYDASKTDASDMTKAWYPRPGWRHADTGYFSNAGSTGRVWGSEILYTSLYNLDFGSSYVETTFGSYQAAAYSVRCIQE